jgi:hypothetical protein
VQFRLPADTTAEFFVIEEEMAEGWREISIRLQDGKTPGRIFLYGGAMWINGGIEQEALAMYSIDWECNTIHLTRKTMILAIYT